MMDEWTEGGNAGVVFREVEWWHRKLVRVAGQAVTKCWGGPVQSSSVSLGHKSKREECALLFPELGRLRLFSSLQRLL